MSDNPRSQRICKSCGKIFFGNIDSLLCSECANISRKNVIRVRICQDCGQSFSGGPRAKRCPDCRIAAKSESIKRYKKTGAKRPLGSMDICEVCGKSYVVVAGRQKYCSPECQREAVLKWQREHKKTYNKQNNIAQSRKTRRTERKKSCTYCKRPFWLNTSSSFCSDYCRECQKKINQCEADIHRGYNRNLEKYLNARDAYRIEVAKQFSGEE